MVQRLQALVIRSNPIQNSLSGPIQNYSSYMYHSPSELGETWVIFPTCTRKQMGGHYPRKFGAAYHDVDSRAKTNSRRTSKRSSDQWMMTLEEKAAKQRAINLKSAFLLLFGLGLSTIVFYHMLRIKVTNWIGKNKVWIQAERPKSIMFRSRE